MNAATIECLMAGETWKMVFSILDEDPAVEKMSEILAGIQGNWYRFRTVCKVSSENIVEKIILNFKLLHLRNCYLSKTVDETIYKNLTSIINTNYIMVINHFLSNPGCANSFVQNLRKLQPQALELLLEICEVLKQQDGLIMTALVFVCY